MRVKGALVVLVAVPLIASLLLHRSTSSGASVSASAPADSVGSFADTIPNPQPPSLVAPEGMAWIPGGEFSMGAQDPPGMDDVGMNATRDSRPIHRVYVDGFWMDRTDVTNAQFERFVRATGYVTVADNTESGIDTEGAAIPVH